MNCKYIEELYYGQYSAPCERNFTHTPEYILAKKENLKMMEQLLSLLPDDQKEMLEKYDETTAIVYEEKILQLFITGFRMGMKIGFEVFSENNDEP